MRRRAARLRSSRAGSESVAEPRPTSSSPMRVGQRPRCWAAGPLVTQPWNGVPRELPGGAFVLDDGERGNDVPGSSCGGTTLTSSDWRTSPPQCQSLTTAATPSPTATLLTQCAISRTVLPRGRRPHDPAAGTLTCLAGETKTITKTGKAVFGIACRVCPFRKVHDRREGPHHPAAPPTTRCNASTATEPPERASKPPTAGKGPRSFPTRQ